MDDSEKELLEYFKCNPNKRLLSKIVMNIAFPLVIPIMFYLDKDTRHLLKEPELWEIIFQKERRIGMLTGSIITNSQYVPDSKNLNFTYERAKTGTWLGVDYLRELELGKKSKKNSKGKFNAFLLEEVKNNPRHIYTPTYLLKILDPVHILQFDTPSLDKLLQGEYVQTITYSNALRQVNQYEILAPKLAVMGISEKEVYQVTPKGNGLIFLDNNFGETSKSLEEDEPVLERLKIN